MASIYTNIDSNNKRTWILMSAFLLLVILVGYASYLYTGNYSIMVIILIVAFFQTMASYWYSDKIILAYTKSKPIKQEDNKELYRLVENLSITAGLPMPRVYVIGSSQINAFATGRDKDHAVIAVTQGLLDRLDKNELQAVLAHELSHIGNKDILLQSVVVVLVGTIVLLSDIFFRIGLIGGNKKEKNPLALVGLVLIILSPIFAKLIQLAISRKREFVADSNAVLLTRYPEGMISALEKISQDKKEMKRTSNAMSHLFIANPIKKKNFLSKMFATHPPIQERINALK